VRHRERSWLPFNSLALAIALSSFACGSDDDDDASGSSHTGDCPDVAGAWTITMHCGAGLIGSRITVDQDECLFSTDGPLGSLSGAIQSDGSFTLRGTANGMSVTCGGVATTTNITQSCEGCNVSLKR
jgi:hypothetical protein